MPAAVDFVKVTRETIVSTLGTNGRVEPIEWAPARAERSGIVSRVLVIRGQTVKINDPLVELDTRVAEAELSKAQAAYGSAKETFDNWILTRTATSDRSQDPEVLARTRALDQLQAAEGSARAARDTAQTDLNATAALINQNDAASTALRTAAQPRYDRARFVEEMKVFGLRLALTLPLLVQISHAGQQQISKRNHPGQRPITGVDYGKPRKTGLRHAKNYDAEGLLRMSHDGFGQNITQ